MVLFYTKEWSYLSCNSDCNRWIKTHYGNYEECVRRHHWKILLAGLAFLGLCWLGFKSMDFERDLMKLWIYNSSRLHNETSYISTHASTLIDRGSTETIIQVTKENILSPGFLLEHLQLMSILVNLEVKYEGRMFTLQSFCRQIQLPRMHYLGHIIRTDIESLMPCEIISPLHCFWEGSHLLTSDHSIETLTDQNNYSAKKLNWSTFDFQVFLNSFKGLSYETFFVNLLNETGIGRGYITKPCIDKSDPACPSRGTQTMDLNGILKNGCYQLAENLYNYPRTLLVGENNRALQSMILLRSAADVLHTLRINDLDWTEDKVQHIMTLWQDKLRQKVIQYNKQRPYLTSKQFNNKVFQSKRTERSNFYTFTNTSLSAALDNGNVDDGTMKAKYVISGTLMTLFVVLMCLWSDNFVRSHCWLAISGTVLIIVAMIAGLGLSAAIGLKFSVLTVQVIPFVALGIGIDDILIVTSSYARHMDRYYAADMDLRYPIYHTLHDCATIISLSFMVKLAVLGAITFVPVPLMSNFCEQVLVIVVLQTGTTVLLYPCLLYLDALRQRSQRLDLLCCLVKHYSQCEDTNEDQVPLPRSDVTSSQVIFSTEFTTSSSSDLVPDNVRQYVEIIPISTTTTKDTVPPRLVPRTSDTRHSRQNQSQCCWKIRCRVSSTFLQMMALVPVHITIISLTVIIVVLGVYSAINLHCGLTFDSIFVRHSNEYNYVKYESSEFRVNNFYVLTKNIDYITCQDLLLQMDSDIKAVANVQVFTNGEFWLTSLIRWLERLQLDLDIDIRHKRIFHNGTWMMNASRNGLMAMTLLVQDRGSINYKKLRTGRLIHSDRVDHSNFYLYLNVWRSVSYDYDAIPCILYPQMPPFNLDNFVPNPDRLQPSIIRMSGKNLFNSNPLQFVTCKYFHRGVHENNDLTFVKTIRAITDTYTNKDLHSVPLGNVFSLSELYFSLKYDLLITALISLGAVFVIGLLTINHLLITVLISIIFISSFFSSFVFLSVYQLPLNGTSGVMVLWSGGLGLRFSLLVIVSYSQYSGTDTSHTASPDIHLANCCAHISATLQSQNRIRHAINTSPCGSILLSTLLSSVFISLANVTFIWQHFFLLPMVATLHSLFNCYCLTPVLCFYMLSDLPIAPTTPEIEISRTTPSTSHQRSHFKDRPRHTRAPVTKILVMPDKHSDDCKLSTIAEESDSVRSSTKSHVSQENLHQPSSSPTQEYPLFVDQDVQSTLTMQYPCVDNKSLSVQTSFKYRHPKAYQK